MNTARHITQKSQRVLLNSEVQFGLPYCIVAELRQSGRLSSRYCTTSWQYAGLSVSFAQWNSSVLSLTILQLMLSSLWRNSLAVLVYILVTNLRNRNEVKETNKAVFLQLQRNKFSLAGRNNALGKWSYEIFSLFYETILIFNQP